MNEGDLVIIKVGTRHKDHIGKLKEQVQGDPWPAWIITCCDEETTILEKEVQRWMA
jgi:hypothetical protein